MNYLMQILQKPRPPYWERRLPPTGNVLESSYGARRIVGRASLLAAAIIMLGGIAPARAQDGQAGKSLFDNTCATCHGRNGQETARGQARRLDALSEDEARAYLRSKQGAEHPQKVYERIKAALSDAEIDALATHIASLRKP